MCSHTPRGFTLIDLLITLCIVGVLSAAIPSLARMVSETRQSSQVFEFQRLLQLARSHAVNSGRITTICGSQDGIECSTDWSSATVLIFVDGDGDHRIGDGDKLIGKVSFPGGRWYWRGSSRAYVRFRPDGTPMEWGRFTLCPFSDDTPRATQLILNFVGRPYTKNVSRQQLRRDKLCI